ncbi:CHASE3 domain-containing protein, partial [Desulfobacterales bacterium HSG2]|nr:CHASE3 domain-containing protein [Desulfobacterales bacterium HSG2]
MNFFRKMSLKTKIMSGICIPLALALIIGIISIINIRSMVRTREWVEHTHKVIEAAERITSSAIDMETGMRGYLLAGKEEFLEPYNHGENATYEFIGSLQKKVSDNPPQVRCLDKAETILRRWQKNVAEPAIAFRREVGKSETMDDIAELIGEAQGKRDFDSFRTLMSDFIAEEEYLEKKREGDEAAAVSRTINIIVLCLIAAFVIGFFIAYVLPDNIQKQVGGEPAVIAGIAREIAEGNLRVSIGKERKTGILAALAEMVEAIDHIVTDIKRVADNVASGDISARGNAGDFKKGWQDLVSGINTVTESLAGHIDQIPVPVIIIDSDFNILFVNRAGADVLARTREQIVGQKCYDQFRTSDCQTAKCACARAMSNGNRETGETEAHPAGRSLFISYSGVPVRNQAGEVVGALEVVMDHTEIQKEAWLKAGQNELNERMRGEQDAVTLTQNILNYLAGCLNVQVGVCYLTENQDSEEDRRLRLVSSFAYKMRNNNQNEFRVGEGLIGQAALEKKSILFAGIPEDHVCMAINSGMGESAARSILVI